LQLDKIKLSGLYMRDLEFKLKNSIINSRK
jgi:hypothetical protein